MMKLKPILASLALVSSFSAVAQPADPLVNQRLLQMLQKIQTASSATNISPTAFVSVGGTFKFNISVTRVSTNTEPMACMGSVTHSWYDATTGASGFYNEDAAGRVVWSGNTGTCTITIPYIWKKASTSSKVAIATSLLPYYPCETTCVERPIGRTSVHDLPDIALPAAGTTTIISDAFRL